MVHRLFTIFLTINGLLICPAQVAQAAGDLLAKCEQEQSADACFDLGFAKMKSKNKNDRHMAVHYISLGCTIKTGDVCSKKQAKAEAKTYRDAKRTIAGVAPGDTKNSGEDSSSAQYRTVKKSDIKPRLTGKTRKR